MSAPELPEELAGHLAVLMDKSDAYAKARAATAIASGKAHLAAVLSSRAVGLKSSKKISSLRKFLGFSICLPCKTGSEWEGVVLW